ncbi:hypothetical protein AAFF_G00259690 [Aldrovandia affinis]|uniref:Uncharacterized protein n=1 Tax=Aldrovandia affinis TaxID=143900 RepID=A0AAD7RCF0_9TELE|nr:hypothetical protein AAFF_G00259690 [Aldrovandia affinis]
MLPRGWEHMQSRRLAQLVPPVRRSPAAEWRGVNDDSLSRYCTMADSCQVESWRSNPTVSKKSSAFLRL